MSRPYVSLRNVFNGAAMVLPPDVAYGTDGNQPLSLAQCADVFNAMSRLGALRLDYGLEGCFARAHLMCRAMNAFDIAAGKAWLFSDGMGIPISDKHNWRYHVAPCVPAAMADGSLQNIVIDPVLFDGPATAAQWVDVMGGSEFRLELVPFGVMTRAQMSDYLPFTPTDDDTDHQAATFLAGIGTDMLTNFEPYASDVMRDIRRGKTGGSPAP